MAAVHGLSKKQIQFCKWYVATHNATQAAIKAGYSERSARNQGARMITNDDIKKYIAALQKESDRCIPNRIEILRQFTEILNTTEKDSIRVSCLIQLAKLQGLYDEWNTEYGEINPEE